jgi:AraC family transcriptional regulator
MKTILQYLDATTRQPSDCGKSLEIRESSRDLDWQGIIVEAGSSPEFYPENVCTPYFYFALDTSTGLKWKARKNGEYIDIHSASGQIWINPPWVPFSHSINEECHFIILAVEEHRFLDAARPAVKQKNIKASDLRFLNTYNIEDDHLKHFIDLFYLEAKDRGRNGRLYLESLLSVFSNYYVSNYSNWTELTGGPPVKSRLGEDDLASIGKTVAENLSERLSIDELSAELNMSKFHFLREFKKVTGETPYRYILRKKMERAEELLLDHDMKLTDIAYSLGFSDQSHFTNTFRRWKGISPGEFRKSNFSQ